MSAPKPTVEGSGVKSCTKHLRIVPGIVGKPTVEGLEPVGRWLSPVLHACQLVRIGFCPSIGMDFIQGKCPVSVGASCRRACAILSTPSISSGVPFLRRDPSHNQNLVLKWSTQNHVKN